ncbi:hypothetical protein [Pseudonocardia nigra]|uniref:hypothetical protein n=1 Tax=Pseudonocardia nigra TaxID=1921578 RepID=UPI001C5DF0D6|nr:hypothetical protein [Pseudonocardia nigra]
MSTHAVLDPAADPADGPDTPRLAEGVELLGSYQGSGYREPKYVISRSDGQVVQLSELLYRLAEALDGRRTPADLAGRLSAELDRDVTAEQVASLIDTKLRPAGLVAGSEADDDGDDASTLQQRSDHLLMLRHRLPVVPERVSWAIAGVFRPLHPPVVVAVLLTAFLALDVAILATGGADAVVSSALAIVDRPALTLLVLGTILLSGVFHEFGHVSACRYGGARPGPMGVGIYIVWPAFYSTVTDTYRLSRAGRLRTDLGGVYFNAVFIAGLSAAYLATAAPWLLVAIIALHVETVRQFLPSIRLDGYYILSDLIGVPDLFTFLVPVLKSVFPGGKPDPRAAQLKPAVRRTIVAWVLFVVPFLAFFLVSFLVLAPQVLPALWVTLQGHLAAGASAVRESATATAVLSVVQVFLLLLPVLGVALILGLLLRRLAKPLLPPRKRPPKTTSRPGRVLAVVTVPVLLVGLLALAGVDQRTATAAEALIAARVAGVVDGSWFEALAAQQIAAVQALLADVGQHTVIDAVRAVMVVFGVLASLLLWPVSRRLGLPAPAAGVAVALSGLTAPGVALHAAVDPGAVAAVWLAVAVVLAGRGRGATAGAYAAAVAAVLTAPVAATGLLAFTAHGILSGQLATSFPRRGRYVLAAMAAAGAAFVAVGVGISAGGAGTPPIAVLIGLLLAGAVVVGFAWYRLPPVRAVATGVAALLLVAAVPGPRSTTVLLLAVPALAVLAAAMLHRLTARKRATGGRHGRPDPAPVLRRVLAAVLVAGLATSVPVVLAASALDPERGALAGWIRTQLAPGVPVHADALTTAQLRRDGIAPDRLLPADGQVPPGAAVVHVSRPGATVADPAGRLLAEFPHGPGGGPVSVRLPGATDGSAGGPDDAAERERLGALLAGNPALTLTEPARQALLAGDVDLRLVTVLSGLASAHRLGIAEFPAVPGEPADAPRRTVLIDTVDGAPATAPNATELVQRWLRGQQPPYRPGAVEPAGDVLIVQYPTPWEPR